MVVPAVMAAMKPSLATIWPAETDIFFPQGCTQVKINSQHPLIRGILQGSIDNMRAFLAFENAFPDAILSQRFATKSLITAAGRRSETAVIHRRLQEDGEYFAKLVSVVRSLVSLSLTHRDNNTNIIHSHARGFAISGLKSRNGAVRLLPLSSDLLATQQLLLVASQDRCRSIHIRIRWWKM